LAARTKKLTTFWNHQFTKKRFYDLFLQIGELERGWMELLYNSLEEILRVMGQWFTPEEVGFSPVSAQVLPICLWNIGVAVVE